jgi:NAD(P)H-flavin reductase
MPTHITDEWTFLKNIESLLVCTVHAVHILNDFCVELIVHAPLIAQNFVPGQLFKLQNFESSAFVSHDTMFAMEGVALNGIDVDRSQGLITFLIYEAGASSMLCRYLKVGKPVMLMGPTGAPTPIPCSQTVLLIATHLHSAVLWHTGELMRKNGCNVIFVVSFKDHVARYKADRIEAAADTVLWCYSDEPVIDDLHEHRPQDLVYHGTILDAITHYKDTLNLVEVDRVLVHGSNALNIMISNALKTQWADIFTKQIPVEGSINAPMQCMMQGICGQCIQIHRDENSEIVTLYYSCKDSHHSVRTADYDFLQRRMSMNSLLEKIAKQWVKLIKIKVSFII